MCAVGRCWRGPKPLYARSRVVVRSPLTTPRLPRNLNIVIAKSALGRTDLYDMSGERRLYKHGRLLHHVERCVLYGEMTQHYPTGGCTFLPVSAPAATVVVSIRHIYIYIYIFSVIHSTGTERVPLEEVCPYPRVVWDNDCPTRTMLRV